MAKNIHGARVYSKSARAKLPIRREPHWVMIAKGSFLGYRRLNGPGTWVARFRDVAGKHVYRALGGADDGQLDADGVNVLSFDQAAERAREWFQVAACTAPGERAPGAYTVADCMADYLDFVKHHRKSHRHLTTYVNAYILPKLGKVDTARLTTGTIRKWAQGIAAEPPRLRTRKGEEQKFRDEDPNPEEALRKRRLRANRHLTTLKAALSRAWREGKIPRNEAWTRVEPFPAVERPRTRFLSQAEAKRLINASPPDMQRLVRLALLTGARYGELCDFDVGDFNPDSGSLFVRRSKTRRSRHIVLTVEGMAFCRQLAAGRGTNEPLLTKDDGTRWGRDHHARKFKDAVHAAKLDPKFTFHELRHTWASLTIMGGAPLMVVAQNLGHSDTRMVERHYGHLANSYVVDVIRRTAPSFGLPDSNVVDLSH